MSNLMILGNAPLTMSSIDLLELINAARAQEGESIVSNRHFLARIEDELDGELPLRKSFTHPSNGQVVGFYDLTHDQCKLVGMRESRGVRRWVLNRLNELEAKQSPAFAIPKSMSEALRLAADLSEQNERLAIERDTAVRTKAEIGSRREATAMATAASAKREAERLKHALGFSARHATILQVEDITGGDYDFAPLRRWCKANEVTPEVVPDKRYPKGVKAWPAGAWLAVYGVSLPELFPCEVAA